MGLLTTLPRKDPVPPRHKHGPQQGLRGHSMGGCQVQQVLEAKMGIGISGQDSDQPFWTKATTSSVGARRP